MKTPAVLLLLLTLGWGGALLAQTSSNPPPSSEAVSKSPVRVKYPLSYRQKAYRMREVDRVLEQQFSCETWPGTDEDRLMTPFQMLAFKSGPSNELQLIAESPQCHFDNTDHRGWDSGPIVLFTPTTNLWVQGVGFLFIETNHWLYISNKVETRLVRSLLKSAMLNGPKTNAPAAPTAPGQLLKIFADGPAIFDNQSNLVRYFHHVHVIDVQLDMTSERLSIQFTTNGAVQTILAEDNVVMTTTNKGWATGPRAFYYITNGSEMTETEWKQDFARCLGVYLAGTAIRRIDRRGQNVKDMNFLALFNAHHEPIAFALPQLTAEGAWSSVLDTALVRDPFALERYESGSAYALQGRSIALLVESSGD